MRIRLYGRLADAFGSELDLAGGSVGAIRTRLASDYPGAADVLARSRVIVGAAIVGDDHALVEADSLEFLPPVSGG